MDILLIGLAILKIIGIVLLVLFCIILFVILTIMLSPIVYRVEGQKMEHIYGDFDLRFLFGGLHAFGKFTEEKGMVFYLKLFGFSVISPDKVKKAKKRTKKKSKKTIVSKKIDEEPIYAMEKKAVQSPEIQAEIEEAVIEEAVIEEPVIEVIVEPVIEIKEEAPISEMPRVRRIQMEEIVERPSIEKDLFEKDLFEKEKMQDWEREWEEYNNEEKMSKENSEKDNKFNIDYFMKIEDKPQIIKLLFEYVKKILKTILPKNLYIKAIIGTGDPALTGYLLGFIGMMKSKFHENLEIKGDFSKACVNDVVIGLKGKIVIGYLAIITLRLIFKKPIWKLIRVYMKG